MCGGYRITFHSGDSWSFNNDTAINVIIFGVDNFIIKNNILILDESSTSRINGSFGSPEKSLVSILLKQMRNFA